MIFICVFLFYFMRMCDLKKKKKNIFACVTDKEHHGC